MVRAMKWLDDIIPDAPYAITKQFLLLFLYGSIVVLEMYNNCSKEMLEDKEVSY